MHEHYVQRNKWLEHIVVLNVKYFVCTKKREAADLSRLEHICIYIESLTNTIGCY